MDGDAVYVIGGTLSSPDRSLRTVEVFFPPAGVWATLSPLPAPRQAHTTSIVSGRIYVIGGTDFGPAWHGLGTVFALDVNR